jgi:signal transduction histidine kinase
MNRRRTLRRHALLIALTVLLSPLLVVMVTSGFESLFGDRTLDRTEQSANEVAAALISGGLEKARQVGEATARKRIQRIRILDAHGTVQLDADKLVGRGITWFLGDIIYGPERVIVLETLDRDLGPLEQRMEFMKARETGHAASCRSLTAGNMFLCGAATHVRDPAGHTFMVYVEGGSRRALQALHESRRQLLKLSLFAAALGVALAYWTMRWFVRPVESLRNELLARATEAVPKALSMPTSRMDLGRTRELGELTDAFNTVLAALAERTRTNEAFLADLAHEFKNPVSAIRVCAERMAEPGPLDEARKERLAEVLKQSAVRLDSLVTQFLELARAEAGLPNEGREPVDVGRHLEGLISSLRSDPRHEGVRFDFTAPSEALTLQGVPQRLDMALRNLLENAASFAGREGWVRVEATRRQEAVEVAITDSGPGIPAADLPRLFDRFFTRRGDRHGTGLGLALTRAVVEAHGGRVEVRSPAGEGATFVVILPLASASHGQR